MNRFTICFWLGLCVAMAPASSGQEACQERTIDLPFAPPVGRANNWCWAAVGQMLMERLGEHEEKACQCQQAEQVLGVTGCCVASGSCVPAESLPARCDRRRWPAFVERSDLYRFEYATTCDPLPLRHNDEGCEERALPWRQLTVEICAGRPVIAALRARGSAWGHTVLVKGISSRPTPRVLVVDPNRLCPPGRRDCNGELDEGFWLTYDEYAAGWDGMVHWVDFYGIRRR